MDRLVEMKNIEKRFPGVVALKNITFDLYSGEVHVLIGENGAGKSTLMKILSGVYAPTSGTITVCGRMFASLTPREAINQGIRLIFQELSVVDKLSVMENIFLGRLPTTKSGVFPWRVDFRKMRDYAREVLDQVGLRVRPDVMVGNLSISQKQQVEIAKALAAKARVIIMDEPTSSLNRGETDNLFGVIETLKKKGVGVIYISHKIRELKRIGDRLTVLKDGVTVGTLNAKDAPEEKIVPMMVGRELTNHFFNRETSHVGDGVVFEARNITRSDQKVENVSFSLKEGEILGFAGLVGAGRTELMNSIFASEPISSGEMYLNGKKLSVKSPYRSIREGVGMITENRRKNGFMDNFEVWRNIAIVRSIKESAMNGIWGLLRKGSDISLAEKYRERMQIKCTSVFQMMTTLSGGNQQKAIIARWLAADARLLIFDEP
ncbi:MAG: ATP-binding cassette domain-containing protein, partial [Synergistaceae bacterium]|nr:ATP-binding cassette domain-containing protein [Synergistaceae bacterium]